MSTAASPTIDEIRALAFDFCMEQEGGDAYTNDPHDPGGPTKYGIALNYNRKVIPDKDGNGVIDAADVLLLTEADARKIYDEVYWRPNRCDAMPGPVAFVYADMVFNPGPGAAASLLQRSLVSLGAHIATDGKVGPATLAALGKVWLPGDTWETPARQMVAPGPLPPDALLTRPEKPVELLLSEARTAKIAEIEAGYQAAVAATLTMPQAAPTAQDVAVGAALLAADDAEGLEYVIGRHAATRAALLARVAEASTVGDISAIAVRYAV